MKSCLSSFKNPIQRLNVYFFFLFSTCHLLIKTPSFFSRQQILQFVFTDILETSRPPVDGSEVDGGFHPASGSQSPSATIREMLVIREQHRQKGG